MPVKNYGLLKGIAIDSRTERDNNSPHYQIHMIGEQDTHYRIAVNVKSISKKSEVLYLANNHFDASSISILPTLKNGFTSIDGTNKEIALDYVRGQLFDPAQMVPLTHDLIGPENDLNDFLELYITQAIHEKATIYVYGSKFGPSGAKDKIFGFSPVNGIHDVHMNQGNADTPGKQSFAKDNGIWQDGGLLIHYKEHWAAVFLAFLTQSWCTNEQGYPIKFCTHTEINPNELENKLHMKTTIYKT